MKSQEGVFCSHEKDGERRERPTALALIYAAAALLVY